MNRVVLIGRLVRDPELKYTPGTGTAVATFSIAVDRRFSKNGQKEADFIRIVAWGKTAELVAQYMSKGRKIGVSGRIQTNSYETKDGEKRTSFDVVAEEVEFLDRASGNGSGTRNNDADTGYTGFPDEPAGGDFGGDMTPVDDKDIPF